MRGRHRWQPGPTRVSPIEAQPALVGLAIPGTCSCAFFFSASTSSCRRALHPSRPSSTPSRNPPPGSSGLLGPQEPAWVCSLSFAFGPHCNPPCSVIMRSELLGAMGPCKFTGRVQTPLAPAFQPHIVLACSPQHETQPLFGDVATGRKRVGMGTIASEGKWQRGRGAAMRAGKERGRDTDNNTYPQAQTRSHLPTHTHPPVHEGEGGVL